MTACTQDRGLLQASMFNRIKTFEEQEKAFNPRILQGIADIFVQNHMHHQYGAGILHRHQELEDGCVMVHTERNVDIDVCQSMSLRDLDVTQLAPTSLFLNEEGNFQGFEYSIDGQKMELGKGFASQLRDFLVANQLQKVVAVVSKPSIVSDRSHDSIEFMHPTGNGTVRIPRQQAGAADGDTTDPVLTEWTFSKNQQGIVECKGNNVCSPKVNGMHKVFVDSKLRSL